MIREMNQIDIKNTAWQIDGYLSIDPCMTLKDRFEKSKKECLKQLQIHIEHTDALTFEQYVSSSKEYECRQLVKEDSKAMPKYPDIGANLPETGTHPFLAINKVREALRDNGVSKSEIYEFNTQVSFCSVYEETLKVCQEWVTVT